MRRLAIYLMGRCPGCRRTGAFRSRRASRRCAALWTVSSTDPGIYNEQEPPEEPRVHIDRAAERTVEALAEPTGVVVIID
jgi:hypothetical protein